MPVINNPSVRPTVSSTPAAATTGAQGTTPATPNQPAGAAPADPALASAAGQIVNAQKVAITGLGSAQMTASGTTSRFARDASFDSYTGAGNGPVSRGFIRCEATPIPGGCRLNVQSFHGNHNDSVTLWLLAEVLDTKTNQLRTVTLAVLANNANLNGTSYRGNSTFDISYADINAYLQQKNPSLKITPGQTQLAVAARWSIGHQAGGFGRGGTFRIPPEARAQNAVSVRAANAARATTNETDLPLDMQVAFPPQLVQQVPQLKPDGNIVSRLESELKGGTDAASMTKAVHEMYRLAEKAQQGDTKEVEKLLGKDWTVETVNRYWLKDDGSANQPGKPGKGFFQGFRVDDKGLPIQDPMLDSYMDDANLAMTRHEGAIRLRKNAAATMINVKPGGGRRDEKTKITQRIEVGLELNANANTADASVALRGLASGQWSGTVFNHAQREVARLDATLNLAQTLVPWLDVTQDRHKFTVKNQKTGVEIELSLDFVKAKTTRPHHINADGTPREVEFCVLEAELDHLQLASGNQGTFVAGNSVNASFFTTEQQQDQWLRATSSNVTMDIDPRLHELKDLENASFRSTSSYVAFEGVAAKLVPALFPKGLESGRQKAAYAAELMGLVSFDDKQLLAAAKRVVAEGGYAWTPALEQATTTAIGNAAARTRLEQTIAAGQIWNVAQFLQQTVATAGVAVTLEYDVAKTKARVADRLGRLGYQSTPEIEAMLDQLTPQLVAPATFESYLEQMRNVPDAQVMQGLATALRVSPVPVPKPDVDKLFAAQGAVMRQQLDAASVDPASIPDVEGFFRKAAAAGATLFELRQLAQVLSSNPQQRLDALATQRQIAGGAPRLKPSFDKVVAQATASLKNQYVQMNDELKAFLKKAIDGRTPQEALQLAAQLQNGADGVLSAEAKRLQVAAPKLAWDMTAIEAMLRPTFTNARIAFDDGMKQLVATCLSAGVPPAILQRVFANLQSQPLPQALKTAGIYLVGVKLPQASYDVAATEQWVRQGLAAYAAWLPAGGALTTWCETLLNNGLTPQQIYSFATYSVAYGRQQAAAYANNPPLSSLPPIPFDVDAAVRQWQPSFSTLWSPAVETFLKDAFPKALVSPAFPAAHVVRPLQYRQLCQLLAQHSGVAMPAGI